MKLMFSIAGGILLAIFALAVLDIIVGTAGSFGSLLQVMLTSEDLGMLLLTLLGLGAVIAFFVINKRYTGRWL